jgi:hypothetical protein
VVLLSPITYPVSLLLDRFIGDMEGAGKDDIKKTREAPDEGVWNKIRGNGHRYAELVLEYTYGAPKGGASVGCSTFIYFVILFFCRGVGSGLRFGARLS